MSSTVDAGQQLGRYVLVRCLGRGAEGEVWEAVLHGPQGFRKPVALKLLRSGPSQDRAGEEGLVAEARLGALLQHPNVVGTYELGEADGKWFVAMELVRGASLWQLAAGGALPGNVLPEIGVQVCAGLAHVHGARIAGRQVGLLHRDIKPGNLLLDSTGFVKVADLGIWGLAGRPGQASGTPGFMSPEQAAGLPQDARSDLFSLGATLYLLATGTRPFGTGESAREQVLEVEERLADGLLDPAEDAVPGLGDVLRRCLRHDPQDRWRSAAELGSALAAIRALQPPGPTLLDVLVRARPDLAEVARDASGSSPGDPTLIVARGNLPAARDAFVGRTAEVERLSRQVRAGPLLVTLLGLGGAGKTRLALEVARSVAHHLPGGAWFFDLSDARDADGLCFRVAQGLSLQLDATDPVRQVGHALHSRGDALFVLDNLEQVVHEAAVVARWAELAPRARFLCTSRVALRVRGEERVPLGSLAAEDGVALFRARAARPIPDDEVTRLVAAVDGTPLAIELLAARSRVLSGVDLLRRLELRLLSGGDRSMPERHRSVGAALEGSFELASPAAALAMAQLSVFEGGFGLESAEAVVDVPGEWAVDLLGELVDASLLRVDEDGRFSVQVLVQQYAASRLGGEARRTAEARHGDSFAQLGSDDALAALYGFGGPERWRRLSL